MTKKTIAGVLVALMEVSGFGADGNMYGNQAQNEGLFVVPKKAPVTVDGKIDSGSSRFPKSSRRSTPTSNRCS